MLNLMQFSKAGFAFVTGRRACGAQLILTGNPAACIA
jgi:hypothetical protein